LGTDVDADGGCRYAAVARYLVARLRSAGVAVDEAGSRDGDAERTTGAQGSEAAPTDSEPANGGSPGELTGHSGGTGRDR
jgi:hypothetical protein